MKKCKFCGEKISLVDYIIYSGMCSLCDEARTLVLNESIDKNNDIAKEFHMQLVNERRKYFEKVEVKKV